MLADSKENRTTYSHGDVDINIDFTRHTFLFATTEPHKVFHALMSRLWKIDLDHYTSRATWQRSLRLICPKSDSEGAFLIQ